VGEWLGEQSEAFRNAIKIVVIDPSAPHASGIRAALPDAKIAVHKLHLVALANQMVTDVRQRVTRVRQWARLTRMLNEHDPTREIGHAAIHAQLHEAT
jgi:transposase